MKSLSLCTILLCEEIETLKKILNSCERLESIKVWVGREYLNENELLETITKHSPKGFHQLQLYYRRYAYKSFSGFDLGTFLQAGWIVYL